VSAVRITVGPLVFVARLEEVLAPRTCAAFRRLLPYRERIIQTRWSGEAAWIPLGDLDLRLGHENHTRGRESFKELGRLVLWHGAQPIAFEPID
jgi:hypothetical protein